MDVWASANTHSIFIYSVRFSFERFIKETFFSDPLNSEGFLVERPSLFNITFRVSVGFFPLNKTTMLMPLDFTGFLTNSGFKENTA